MHASSLLLAFALAAAPAAAQSARYRPLKVVGVHPRPNALAVPAGTPVIVEFNLPLDLAHGSARSFQVAGRWSGVCPGTYSLEAQGRRLRFVPDRPFSAGEMVSVYLADDLEASLGGGMGHGLAWSFWIASRAGTRSFTSAGTFTPGNVPYGAYGGDIDGDGDLDLCVPNEGSFDVTVFLNNGAAFDPPIAYPVGRRASANEAADLDYDGDLDLVVANVDDGDVSVLFGVGDGTFLPQVRHGVGLAPRGVAILDVDGDGDLDVVTSNRASDDMSLLANRGDGGFDPEQRIQGGVMNETGVAASDMDLDGLSDLTVIGYGDGMVRTLLGNGKGMFAPLQATAIGSTPWNLVVGDVDADGDNDVAATLAFADSVAVAMNGGGGVFAAPTTYAVGPFALAVDLGDLDGDGLLDMTATSFNGATFNLYFNQGGGVMGNFQTLPASMAGSCTVLHDIDGDGDLDITGIDERADEITVFLQDG